jgi:NAD(P)-dependent dehydrogenase (short-subunit alcohol dehydrogenase family)
MLRRMHGKKAVVTGGGSGIGRAICSRLAAEGARVVVADRDGAAAARVAAEIGGAAFQLDVARAAEIEALVREHDPIDVLVSNAGVAIGGGPEAPDDDWQRAWDIHVMAQVRAVRAVLPGMLARGAGVLVTTASAAGLLTNLDAAPYAVTKHAAVAFAEWLAVTYGDRGIQVACICPMAVRTPMLEGDGLALSSVKAAGATVEPEQVAEALVRALAEKRFLVLPHPEVADFVRRKATDPDGWIARMQQFRARLQEK